MTLAWDSLGAGHPVLLVHSTVCDRRMWQPQMSVLAAAGYRAIRCDLQGFGETPAPAAPYDDAGDLDALLDALGVEQVALVAASGGGQVALEFAARRPGRVTALALLATALAGHPASPARRAFAEREDQLLAAGELEAAAELNVRTWVGPAADEQTRARVRDMQRHNFEVQLAAAQEFPELDTSFDLADITADTLLVSGDHDLIDFREIAVELAGRLPRARHVPLPWAGHLPSLESPERLNPLLLDFLRTPAAAPG